jgi:hypothetical protein
LDTNKSVLVLCPVEEEARLPAGRRGKNTISGRFDSLKQNALSVISVACLLASSVAILVFAMSSDSGGKRDFIAYWAAGQQLAHGENPYDPTAILRLERPAGLEGNRPNLMLNLPTAFFLVLPLGYLSARTGGALWLLALIACLMASNRMLWMLYGRPAGRLHLLGYLFAPVLACLIAGQLGIFILLGVVLFLHFHQSSPFLAGAALLLCAIKPHLFVPFGLVLLAWGVNRKAYRLLSGTCVALLASTALSFCVDRHAWPQYARMMKSTAEVQQDFVPTFSMGLRLMIDRNALWLQFLPLAAACIWALWYFWTRRASWDWMEEGLLLLLVSEACSPHAWFTDEAIVLPAILAAVYRTDAAGRSLLPFGLIAGVALIEVLTGVQVTSPFYMWTAPAWLLWYLFATRKKVSQPPSIDVDATIAG